MHRNTYFRFDIPVDLRNIDLVDYEMGTVMQGIVQNCLQGSSDVQEKLARAARALLSLPLSPCIASCLFSW